jgi:hypothetical protein
LKKYPHITEQIEKTIVARFRIELKTILETSTTPEKQLVMIENLVKDTYPQSVQRALCNMIPTALDTYVNDLYRQLMENVHSLDANNMQDCIKNFKRLKALSQGGSTNVQIIPIEEAIVQKVVQYTTNATANQQLETMLNELVSNLTVSTEEIQKVKNRLEETKLEEISTIVTSAKEFLDASSFEQVAKCLLELKQVSSNHFSSVQQLVQTRVDEVYNQTLFKANHLDVSDMSAIEKINESLEWISNASMHIGGLMYESVQVERIVEQKTKDYIHATLGLIHAGQYDQVSTRQSHLNAIIKLVNVSTLTVDQVNQLSGELDASVKGIAQKYKTIPLEEYSSIPPIEMIAKLKNSNPSVAQDIETVISLRFKTEIKSIDTSEKATDLIISLNVLLSLYPTHLRDTLRTELQVIAHQHVNKIESRLITILEQSWITAQELQLFNELYNQRESLKKVDLLKDYRYEPLRKRFKGYTDALVKQVTEKKHFENVVENLRLVKDKIPDFSSLAAQEINKLEKQFK